MSETPILPASPASPTKDVKTTTATPGSPSKEVKTPPPPTTTNNSNTKKFEGDGLTYKSKLIGVDELTLDRDEKICLDSMFKLKAVARARGEHKQRITLHLTMSGVKVMDDATKAPVACHEIERISFVVTDPGDNRAFGYIFNTPDDRHQFWAFKTERAAAATVLSLKELFDLVFEHYAKTEKEKLEANKSTTSVPSPPVSPSDQLISTQESSPPTSSSPPPTSSSPPPTSPPPTSPPPTSSPPTTSPPPPPPILSPPPTLPPPPTSSLPSPPPPPPSIPVVPTATPSPLDDLLGDISTTTTTQTTVPIGADLWDINAPPVPVIQPAPKLIDPLEELFGGLSTNTTTQPATSMNTTNPLLNLLPNAAPPSSNPFANFSPQTTDVNLVNATSISPQQQPYIARAAPPPPLQPQQQQNILAPRSLSPVTAPAGTNPFADFDILGDLTSGTTTKTTKESFFPSVPPPKTIQQLQMEKQRNRFARS